MLVFTAGRNEYYNTGAPLYSKTLAETWGMRKVYVQYYFYISAVFACGFALCQVGKGLRALGRARELGRAAYLKEQGRPYDEWMDHVALADATELRLIRLSNFIKMQEIKAKGHVLAAVNSPSLWLSYVAYRRLSESQQAQSSETIKK